MPWKRVTRYRTWQSVTEFIINSPKPELSSTSFIMDYFFLGGYSSNSFLMSFGSFSEILDTLLSSSR